MGPRTRRASILAAVVVALTVLPVMPRALAAPGDGDATYGTKGFVAQKAPQGRDVAVAIEPMADGRVVVLAIRDQATFVVTRLLASGGVDPTFGGGDGQAELVLGKYPSSPTAGPAALLVHPDGAVTVVALDFSYPSVGLATGRLTPAGVPDTAWAPNGTRNEPLPGMYLDGPTAHRLPSGELIVVVRTYHWNATVWYHHTVRVQPTLSVQTREISTEHEEDLFAPTLIDAAGLWIDVTDRSYLVPGVGYGSELVITRRTATGALDPTYGVGGIAHVRVPLPQLDDSRTAVVEADGDLVIATGDGILRVDGLGRLRTELGDGGVARADLGPLTDLLRVGSDLVVVSAAGDSTGRSRCVATSRFSAALVPVAAWGDGGRSVVCPRPDRNDLAGAIVSGGAVRLLTTSTEHADRDDSVTVTGLGPTGAIDAGYGTGGRVDLRDGFDGTTNALSMARLPDGGAAIAIDAPDGLGIARVDAAGALVPSFGTAGFATTLIAGTGQGPVVARSNGGFLVGGTRGVAAFTSSGALDATFGAGGFAAVDGGVADLLPLTSGRILVIAGGYTNRLVALQADGSLDLSVGAAGELAPGFVPKALVARGTGAVVVGDFAAEVRARAYTGTLTPDGTFAGGGVLVTDTLAASHTDYEVASGPLGRTYVATQGSGQAQITAITTGGTVDPTFTSPDFSAVNPDPLNRITAMTVDALGRLIVAGPTVVHLERLLPTGAHDPTFGDAGVLELDADRGTYRGVVDLAMDAQDRVVGVVQSSDAFLTFRTDVRVPADLPTVSVPDAELVERGPGALVGRSVAVTLDRPSAVPVTVLLAVTGGTATEGTDYTQWDTPVRVVIPRGATTWYANLSVAPDGDVEPDETITFRIAAAYQAVVGDGTGTLTIKDDDALRSLDAGNGFVRVGLGAPADEPADPNDPAVAGYYLAASQDGAFVTGYVTKGDVASASIAGLRNGVPAQVTVTPFTSGGRLLPDRSGTATPRVGGPAGNQHVVGVPTNLTVVQGDGHLTAKWGPPADDGGSPVWAYLVVAQDVDGAGAFGYTYVEGRSFSLDGLTNGRRYTVSVAPVSGLGFGGYATTSATPRATGRAVTEPQPPNWTVITTSPDRKSATVALGTPPDDGGSPIVEYTVIAVQRAKPMATVTTTPAHPQVTLSGLDPALGTTYVITTRNRRGLGTLSLAQPADFGAGPAA